MDDAATFMILDGDSGNALASFADEGEAQACLRSMAEGTPTRAADLALIAFDKDGFALSTHFASDLPQFA